MTCLHSFRFFLECRKDSSVILSIYRCLEAFLDSFAAFQWFFLTYTQISAIEFLRALRLATTKKKIQKIIFSYKTVSQ